MDDKSYRDEIFIDNLIISDEDFSEELQVLKVEEKERRNARRFIDHKLSKKTLNKGHRVFFQTRVYCRK